MWGELGLENERVALTLCTDQREFLFTLLRYDEPKKMLVIALLWNWWLARNKVNSGERKLNRGEVMVKVRRSVADYENFFLKKPKRTVQNCVWQRPEDQCGWMFQPRRAIRWLRLYHTRFCRGRGWRSFASRGWNMLCSYSVWTGVGNVSDHHWNRCSGIGAGVDIRGLWSILKWSSF